VLIIHFNAQHLKGKRGIINIVNINGQQVYQKPIEILNGEYATQQIDVSNFPNCMYFINLQTERERVTGRVIVDH
jgi:hypothetical protein